MPMKKKEETPRVTGEKCNRADRRNARGYSESEMSTVGQEIKRENDDHNLEFW